MRANSIELHARRIFLLAGFSLLVTAPLLLAAAERTASKQLDPIVVKATRLEDEQSRLPVAVGTVSEEDIQLGRQQLGLDESLANIPGLFFQNRYNFAQDLRIAVRGFGARANFGIRGIRIFADGIPQTLPDGQSSVDAIDLGSARRIEVIRGPFSSVYGAASGGVINILSEDGPAEPFVSGRINAGSYSYAQGQLKAGGQSGNINYFLNGSGTTLDSYRKHSRYRSKLLNSKIRYELDDGSDLTLLLNAVDSPTAEDPGGLTRSEVVQDRKQAAPRNLLFDAGEELDQQTLGLAYSNRVGAEHEFKLRNYYVFRDFRNRLPFEVNSNGQGGSVDLERLFVGVGGNYAFSGDLFGKANRMVLGVDIDAQRDHRKRYANVEGRRGERTTDQDEDVSSYGVYVQNALEIAGNMTLTLGARFDRVDYEVDDNTGGDGSGNTEFDELSPMIGLVWRAGPGINLYGNVARSFDPPTTTELANPRGTSGFNTDLRPQKATNYEIGAKGLLSGRIRYELAVFRIDVDDQLVSYELAGSGQSFFENAATSTHQGLESSITLKLLPGLTTRVAYTYSDFSFDTFRDRDGNDFGGNELPGIPDSQLHLAMDYRHPGGFFASWDVTRAGSFYADNDNAVKSGAYTVANLRAGLTRRWNQWEMSPFVGINNLFGQEYFDNIRLNAGNGRYYEPAPERNFYGGIAVRFNLACPRRSAGRKTGLCAE